MTRAARQGGAWAVERRAGSAAELHSLAWPEPLRRTVTVCSVAHPALVLGSTQAHSVVDHQAVAAAGMAVVRRRSGGGAVLLEPGAVTWIDVVLPAGDPLWVADVGVSFHWLGRVWAAALDGLGWPGQLKVNQGRAVETEWSRLVCFAGLGQGEVFVASAGTGPGPKLVGMSQRRTRTACRFQCSVHHRWRPERLVRLLALDATERERAAKALAGIAAEVTLSPAELADRFIRHLPA